MLPRRFSWSPAIRLLVGFWLTALAGQAFGADFAPSFDCTKATDPVAPIICGDRLLSDLDTQMAGIYSLAARQLGKEDFASVKAAQREWWTKRSDCLTAGDVKACIKDHLLQRSAELQASLELQKYPGLPTIDAQTYDIHLADIDQSIRTILSQGFVDRLHTTSELIVTLQNKLNSIAAQSDKNLDFELILRAGINRIIRGDFSTAAAVLKQSLALPASNNQIRRYNLLVATADKSRGIENRDAFAKYCERSDGRCDWNDYGNAERTAATAQFLGYPPEALQRVVVDRALERLRNAATVEEGRIEAEEAATRAASAAVKARVEAEQNAERQRIAAAQAAEEQRRRDEAARLTALRQASEKVAAEEAERQRRSTFGYRMHSAVEAFGLSIAKLWDAISHGAAAGGLVLGFLLHRSTPLRVALALCLALHLGLLGALLSLYPLSGLSDFLTAVPAIYISLLFGFSSFLNNDAAVAARASGLSGVYLPLSLAAYVGTLFLVGPGVRQAERARLRRFLPARFPLSGAWTEWRQRRRLLKEAQLQARLAMIQHGAHAIQGGTPPYPYPYAPPGVGGVVRGFFGFTREVFSLVKVVVISATVIAVLIYGKGFIDQANGLLTKAQAFNPPMLNSLRSFFK